MRADEVLVGQVEPGRDDPARHHPLRPAEVVLVVEVAGGAVRCDQRRAPAAARAPGALGVVGGSRWHVAQADGVQRRDVDTELHGRRAVEQREQSVPEGRLPLLPILVRDLGGVLGGVDPRELLGVVAVEVAEEAVDPHSCPGLHRLSQGIQHPTGSITGRPDEGGGLQPVAWRAGCPVLGGA